APGRLEPAAQVLFGCTMMPGRMIAPGHVATQGNGAAVFRGFTDVATDFANSAEINAGVFTLRHSEETDQIIWQKAAFNCAMNACAALTGARVGELVNGEGMKSLLFAVSAEVVALANSRGVAVDAIAVREQIEHALAHHTEHKPSMLQDIEAGRETEIESLSGEVARLADGAGVAAPLNTALAALVRQKSISARAGR
ncbi:MAG: ketopantoate reductase C-terminal domain-containing protein, partial [Pseudomonadota bacterium]